MVSESKSRSRHGIRSVKDLAGTITKEIIHQTQVQKGLGKSGSAFAINSHLHLAPVKPNGLMIVQYVHSCRFHLEWISKIAARNGIGMIHSLRCGEYMRTTGKFIGIDFRSGIVSARVDSVESTTSRTGTKSFFGQTSG